jgi:hypothetical protein
MATMAAVVEILKIANPKYTTTYPKEHSCKVSLLSDQENIF